MENNWLNPAQGGGGDPKPPDTSWLTPAKKGTSYDSVTAIGGVQQAYNPAEFDFQLKFNQDNRLLRAQNQSNWAQAGLMVVNGASNILTGIVEGFGYIPELFDSRQDYSNELTEQMRQWKNPFGEIYRENPDEVWDMSDPAWWFSNVQQLAESAGAFAIQGIGMAKIFGTLAKGAATAVNAGKLGHRIAQGVAELGTATTLAYTEGAMSGYQVYEKTYQQTLERAQRQGLSVEEAHATAAQTAGNAAATTVTLNTIMNTVMNLGSLGPLFRNPDDKVLAWMRSTGARSEGETLAAWKSRLKAAAAENPQLKQALSSRHGWSSVLMEPFKEGVEEINTMYAEQVGAREAEGREQSLFGALTNISQYLEDVTNEEGALNFVLGAFGGAAQTVLVDHLPTRSVIKYDQQGNPIARQGADGKAVMVNGKPAYEKQLVSAKAYNEFGARRYFENIRDALVTDIEYMDKKQAQLIKAMADGNSAQAEKLRSEIFAFSALSTVSQGLTDMWISTYEEIAALDNSQPLSKNAQETLSALRSQSIKPTETQPVEQLQTEQVELAQVTEAMQKGFAKDMNDHEYKERARQAIEELKYLRDIHQTIQRKYADENNPATGELADHLFRRTADLYLRKRSLDRESKRIEKLEQMENFSIDLDENLFDHQVKKYNEKVNTLNDTIAALNNDLKAIEAADNKGDVKTLLSMIEKYRAKGVGEEDLAGAVNDLGRILRLKIKQYDLAASDARQTFESSVGYTSWAQQNPGRSFEEYNKQLGENVLLRRDRANLEIERAQVQIAQQQLEELTTQKGQTQMLQAFAARSKKLTDAINERQKKDHMANFLQQHSREAAARLDAKQKSAMTELLGKRIENLEQQLTQARTRKATAEAQLQGLLNKTLGFFRNISQVMALKSDIAREVALIKTLEAQLASAQEQLALVQTKAQKAAAKAAKVEQKTTEELIDEEADQNEDYEEKSLTDPYIDALNSQQLSENKLEELAATEEELAGLDPVQQYMDLRNSLPQTALGTLDRLEEFFASNPLSFQSFINAFREQVNLKLLTQAQVNQAFLAFRDYLQFKTAPKPEVNPAQSVEETPAVPEQQQPAVQEAALKASEVPLVEESVQPEIMINRAMFTEEALENAYWEQTQKTTDAVKANSSDLQYIPVRNGEKLMLRNITRDDGPVLDETANKDRLLPGAIEIGDEVELSIDTQWDGKILNDFEVSQDEYLMEERIEDRYENYLDEQGKIRVEPYQSHIGYGNIPIKIVHLKTGKVLGYLPRVSWITATQGAGNFRNVEDLLPADANGERHPGNVELQMEINLQIRRHLALMHNANPGATLRTQVSQRTVGQTLMASELTESTGKVKVKLKTAATLLPDPELYFGVMTANGPMMGLGVHAASVLPLVPLRDKERDNIMGAPIVFLPMPNGQYKVTALHTVTLGEREADMRTVERAIELYLLDGHKSETQKDKDDRALIQKLTHFDLSDELQLRDFIEQYYTRTSGFNDASIQADAQALSEEERANRQMKFKLAIPGKGTGRKSPIKVGTTFSGNAPVYAQIKDGKLDPLFARKLREGLSTRFKNVTFKHDKLTGLNDKARPITEIYVDKNGSVKVRKHHKSYNDYLKSFVYTNVYGKTQVNGRYVYAANSQVLLDKERLLPQAYEPQNALEQQAESPQQAGQVQEVTSPLDELFNFHYRPAYVRHTIQPQGMDLNLDNLQQLHKFTPEATRNDKSPQQVLNHLQSLGITRIAEGYNPFEKCT